MKDVSINKNAITFTSIVIVFIVIVIYGLNYTTPPIDVGTAYPGEIIVSANTLFSIQPSHYTYIHFAISKYVHLYGNLTSSTYISVYIMNQTNFENFSHGKRFIFIYYVFADSGGVLNIPLIPGIYYIIFDNKNTQWGVGVQITSPIYLSENF